MLYLHRSEPYRPGQAESRPCAAEQAVMPAAVVALECSEPVEEVVGAGEVPVRRQHRSGDVGPPVSYASTAGGNVRRRSRGTATFSGSRAARGLFKRVRRVRVEDGGSCHVLAN